MTIHIISFLLVVSGLMTLTFGILTADAAESHVTVLIITVGACLVGTGIFAGMA